MKHFIMSSFILSCIKHDVGLSDCMWPCQKEIALLDYNYSYFGYDKWNLCQCCVKLMMPILVCMHAQCKG